MHVGIKAATAENMFIDLLTCFPQILQCHAGILFKKIFLLKEITDGDGINWGFVLHRYLYLVNKQLV